MKIIDYFFFSPPQSPCFWFLIVGVKLKAETLRPNSYQLSVPI